MTGRDALFAALGWQLAVAARFAAEAALSGWDRRKARRTRTAPPTVAQ